jgi:pimeloyl-ACP methyl ester carboxylesterase
MTSIFESPRLNHRLFFPRRNDMPPPPGARDDMLPVAPGVRLHCRIYPAADARFRLLYFHGNGETVADHDSLFPEYARLGARWLVCDYRGYGRSDGEPSLPLLLADAVTVYNHIRATPDPLPLAVMGRSLGSAPAIELGGRFPDIAALVIESGYADPLGLVRRRGIATDGITPVEAAPYDNARKMRRVRCPLLVLHGARDHLIAPEEARMNIEEAGSEFKQLEILEGVGHNDILSASGNAYFRTLDRFFRSIFSHKPSG